MLFLTFVILPTLLSVAYYGFLASDVYVSESHFVIRNQQSKAPSMLGALLLQGTNLARSLDDTHTLHDYIKSRDALAKLLEKYPLREMYGDKSICALDRFPGITGDTSFESLFQHYNKVIDIAPNPSNQISVLKVRAFTAEDARKINYFLLEIGENLINSMNNRAREDTMNLVKAEVELAEHKSHQAYSALSSYRNAKQIFDPERQGEFQLRQISKLQEDLLSAKTQLALIGDQSSQSPHLLSIHKRIQLLNNEIEVETGKVVGSGTSLANEAVEYEKLARASKFAEKSLTIALASLETARNEAQRKQLYLERIVEPNLPDIALEPVRWKGVLETVLISLVLWGIASMLIAGIKEHQS